MDITPFFDIAILIQEKKWWIKKGPLKTTTIFLHLILVFPNSCILFFMFYLPSYIVFFQKEKLNKKPKQW